MKDLTIVDIIDKFNTVSIIGMDKNVGKTTVLNYIIDHVKENKYPLGLTSIGRDGEKTDLVTSTEKPRIYVRRGTYIATAKQCLSYGDITKEILAATDIHTAMGEVIMIKALSDGYVDLGGPSVNSQMANICSYLRKLGCRLVLVDGALSRKTFASPSITEATILSTGASLSRNMNLVVEKTVHAANLLSTYKEEDEGIINLCNSTSHENRINIIYKNYTIESLELETSLDAAKDIVSNLGENVSHIYIKGIISDKLLNDIMKSTDEYKNVTFLAEDGTKLFITKENLQKFKARGGDIKVLNPINLLCITCNPKSPFGYEFDKNIFIEKLRCAVNLPVFDVLNEE